MNASGGFKFFTSVPGDAAMALLVLERANPLMHCAARGIRSVTMTT
jgi:hypothetical protein